MRLRLSFSARPDPEGSHIRRPRGLRSLCGIPIPEDRWHPVVDVELVDDELPEGDFCPECRRRTEELTAVDSP